MNNKKGISAIVATVLIILITVAAVTIIWAAIIPMISNQLDKGTVCINPSSQVTIKNEGYSCWNATDGNVSVQVSHGAGDFDLAGVQVLVFEGGVSASTEITTGLPGVNEDAVIKVPYTTGTPDRVEIAPIVAVGNSDQNCGVSSSLVLEAC